MGLFDDLFDADENGTDDTGGETATATESPPETAPSPQPAPTTNGRTAPPSKHSYLYLDLETCPDYSRMDQFDLPALPPLKTDNLMSAKEFCSQTLAEVKQWLDENLPPEWWMDNVEKEEKTRQKPRAGLFDSIGKARNLVEGRRKLLSVTPEYCRIVAWAWATGGGEIVADVNDQECKEAQWLEWFWAKVADVRTIIGFNILHFDLPVILIRSALLGITPSRRINLSPYRNTDVCDLMTARWPKGGQMKLKSMAKALGIEIPAGDCDGSQVEDLYNRDPEKLKEYVTSDVEVTRQIHRYLSGYFWE